MSASQSVKALYSDLSGTPSRTTPPDANFFVEAQLGINPTIPRNQRSIRELYSLLGVNGGPSPSPVEMPQAPAVVRVYL